MTRQQVDELELELDANKCVSQAERDEVGDERDAATAELDAADRALAAAARLVARLQHETARIHVCPVCAADQIRGRDELHHDGCELEVAAKLIDTRG